MVLAIRKHCVIIAFVLALYLCIIYSNSFALIYFLIIHFLWRLLNFFLHWIKPHRAKQKTLILNTSSSKATCLGRNCTFERNLCGFTQVKSDTFDWTRMKGATPTTGSGPSRDHTNGRGEFHVSFNLCLKHVTLKR